MSNASDFIIENGILKKYNPTDGETKVVIPSGVHTLGSNVFKGCDMLNEIVIPESVKSIQPLAFDGCINLQELILPDSVTEIGFGAFYNCRQLKTLRIPSGVQTAKYGAFAASDHEIVPDPRLKLFQYAFYGCTCLKEVIALGVKETDASFAPMETWGALQLELPCYVMPGIDLSQIKNTRIKQALLLGYLSDTGKYTNHEIYRKLLCAQKKAMLPLYLKTDNVAAISILAEEKKITVKNYEEEFLNPAIETGATQIKAFLLAWKNETVGAKNTDKTMKLEQKETPVSLTALKKIWGWEDVSKGRVNVCHYKGKDSHVVIPSTLGTLRVIGVGASCFSTVGRKVVPERRTFFATQLQSVEISSGITSIGTHAFASCKNLQTIVLADTVNEIGASSFHFCENLTHILGLVNVKYIRRSAFEFCRRLEGDLYLTNVASVEVFAFSYCQANLNIHFSESVSYIDGFAFSGCDNLTIYAPAGSYAEEYAKENNIPFVAE